MHLECPRDGSPLVPGNPDEKMCHCPRCEGVFLDRDAEFFARLEVLRRSPEGLAEWEGGFSCPCCGKGMRGLAAGEAQLDLCFGCHCVWLDSGELQKMPEWAISG